jgi:hypothetical protein
MRQLGVGRATDPEPDQNRSTSTSTSTATYIAIAALLVVSAVFFYTYTSAVPDPIDVSQGAPPLIDPAPTAAGSTLSLADATIAAADATSAAAATASALAACERSFSTVNTALQTLIGTNQVLQVAFAAKISATRDFVVATSKVESARKTRDAAAAYVTIVTTLQSAGIPKGIRGISQTSRASTSDAPTLAKAQAELAAAEQAYNSAQLAHKTAVASLAEATQKAAAAIAAIAVIGQGGTAIADKFNEVIVAARALAKAEVAKSSADDRVVSAAQSVAAAARTEADEAVKANSGGAKAKLEAADKAEEAAATLEAQRAATLKAADAARLAAAAATTPSATTPAAVATTPASVEDAYAAMKKAGDAIEPALESVKLSATGALSKLLETFIGRVDLERSAMVAECDAEIGVLTKSRAKADAYATFTDYLKATLAGTPSDTERLCAAAADAEDAYEVALGAQQEASDVLKSATDATSTAKGNAKYSVTETVNLYGTGTAASKDFGALADGVFDAGDAFIETVTTWLKARVDAAVAGTGSIGVVTEADADATRLVAELQTQRSVTLAATAKLAAAAKLAEAAKSAELAAAAAAAAAAKAKMAAGVEAVARLQAARLKKENAQLLLDEKSSESTKATAAFVNRCIARRTAVASVNGTNARISESELQELNTLETRVMSRLDSINVLSNANVAVIMAKVKLADLSATPADVADAQGVLTAALAAASSATESLSALTLSAYVKGVYQNEGENAIRVANMVYGAQIASANADRDIASAVRACAALGVEEWTAEEDKLAMKGEGSMT